MRGSAVVSAGGSDEMERLKKAFAQDTSAGKILESDNDPAQVLASLRSLGGETGAAVSGYLDLVGNRLIDIRAQKRASGCDEECHFSAFSTMSHHTSSLHAIFSFAAEVWSGSAVVKPRR
jgi:hypothetical protein